MAYVPRRKRKPYSGGAKPLPVPGGTYLPNEERLVRILAAKGASDAEIEQLAGIPTGTLGKWRKLYKGLDKALEEGRSKPDGDVLYALYKNAVGHDFQEEQAVGGRETRVVKVKRHQPGSFAAQKFWLTNRQRETWKDRMQHTHTGSDGGPIGIKVEDRNTVIDQILSLVSPKPDPVVEKKK